MAVRIFVYGTLMPGHCNFDRFLGHCATNIEKSKVKAEMYSFGGFPGLVDRGDEWAYGYTMMIPVWNLAALDALEGVGMGFYYRAYKPVYDVADNNMGMAQTYFIPVDRVKDSRLKRVKGGKWVDLN